MLQDTQTYSTINQRKEIARPLSQVRVSLLVAYEMILKVAQEVLTGSSYRFLLSASHIGK